MTGCGGRFLQREGLREGDGRVIAVAGQDADARAVGGAAVQRAQIGQKKPIDGRGAVPGTLSARVCQDAPLSWLYCTVKSRRSSASGSPAVHWIVSGR